MEVETFPQDIVAHETVRSLIVSALKIYATLGCTEQTNCYQCILCDICDDLSDLLGKLYPETGLRRTWLSMEE